MPIEAEKIQELILRQVDDLEFSKTDVSKIYALGRPHSEHIDWKKVNKAIVKRWGVKGLVDIKEMAYKLSGGKYEK